MLSAEEITKIYNQAEILGDIEKERIRQDKIWGEQHWPDGTDPSTFEPHAVQMKYINDHTDEHTWTDIFLEEVYEALTETDPVKLRTELIQCAAVAVAWTEDIDGR